MTRWIFTLAITLSSACALADPIQFDETSGGDLDGSQVFEFGLGDNVISGSSQSTGTITGARDLDAFSFILADFNAISSITFDFSGGLTGDSDEASARMTFRIVNESGDICSLGGLWSNVLAGPGSRTAGSCGGVDLSDLEAGSYYLSHGMTVGDGTTGDSWNYSLTFAVDDTRSVPEPGTLSLLGLGLLAIGASRRRRKT